jgi:hypothetical protein
MVIQIWQSEALASEKLHQLRSWVSVGGSALAMPLARYPCRDSLGSAGSFVCEIMVAWSFVAGLRKCPTASPNDLSHMTGSFEGGGASAFEMISLRRQGDLRIIHVELSLQLPLRLLVVDSLTQWGNPRHLYW